MPEPAAAHAARPFVRWAGGKRRLLKWLVPALPVTYGDFYEPFVGGGALLFALAQEKAGQHCTISDVNPDLAVAYSVVRDDLEGLIAALQRLGDGLDDAEFRRVRSLVPEELSDVERAARLIYLNKTCFNGLWRVDKQGRFNAPRGKFTSPPNVVDVPTLTAAHTRLQGARVLCTDYRTATAQAGAGDLVYFDPPYLPLTASSSFSSYASSGFGISQHKELAEACRDLTARGVNVMLSNSDTALTREVFGACGLNVHGITVPRTIAADTARRQPVGELLAFSWPLTACREPGSLPFS